MAKAIFLTFNGYVFCDVVQMMRNALKCLKDENTLPEQTGCVSKCDRDGFIRYSDCVLTRLNTGVNE